jgi:hypothetical protein
MNDQFEWKAEITFKGTADEFNRFSGSLQEVMKAKLVTVTIPDWKDIPRHLAGCMRVQFDHLLDKEIVNPIIEGMTRVQVNPLTDIAGGIRTPHLHLNEEVVLLNRERFKMFAGEIARELAIRRAEVIGEHVGVMNPIGGLVDDIGDRPI